MQKILLTLFSFSVMCSCDYSSSSNGNIDAAYAREAVEKKSHDEAHHGGTDAAEHKDNDAKDHVESHAGQDQHDALVVPTDTSAHDHAEHSEHH